MEKKGKMGKTGKKKMGKGLGALLDEYNSSYAVCDSDLNSGQDVQALDKLGTADAAPDGMIGSVSENPDGAAEEAVAGKALSGQAVWLKTSEIEPDRNQPRMDFDEQAIEELAMSVMQHGILQPILVRKVGDGYRIVAGERRWRAAMKAKLKEIPALIKELTELEAAQLSLIENLQRESLNPIEEALGYKRLVEEFSMTQEEAAKRVSKPRSAVANSLRLLKLPQQIQHMLRDGEISAGHAKVLAGLENSDQAVELAERVRDEKLSVRELERLAKKPAAPAASAEKRHNVKLVRRADEKYYTELELAMTAYFGRNVYVKAERSGRLKMNLDFKDQEDLESFVKKMTMASDESD